MKRVQENIGFLLVLIGRAHRNQLDAALNTIGLFVGQEHVIYQLHLKDGIPQGQLARSLFVDLSTATKMLVRMEKHGLIERRPDEEDARVSRVYLTEKGRALVGEVISLWSQIEDRLLMNMTETEQALLRRLLLQLYHNIS